MKKPSSGPNNYKTLSGLLKAAERVLEWELKGGGRCGGMSTAMWLHNAQFIAQDRFKDTSSVQALRKKYSVTRCQDLIGGHAVFGFPLPTREYGIGDNVPGVGCIDDVFGEQLQIAGNWYHKCCFEQQSRGG